MGTGALVTAAPFSWGPEGNIIIRSLKFTNTYDQAADQTVTKESKNRVTESMLSWVNKEFILEDLRIIDFDKGQTVDIPSFKAKFKINDKDEFECLLDTEEILSDYIRIHRKKIEPDQEARIIEKVRNECKILWDYSRQIWVKHKSLISINKIQHARRGCYELNLNKEANLNELQEYLIKKYNPDQFGLVQRRAKAKIIVERDTSKPHLVFLRTSSYAEISKNSQIISEVREEMRLYVFCWYPELQSESLIKSEIRKMNEMIKIQLKEFTRKLQYRSQSKFL
jgi:DNA-binding cell septation regulator SpoVG